MLKQRMKTFFGQGFGTHFMLSAHGETTRQANERADQLIKKKGP